ncbi:hypothetical protein [Inquilinus sp. OTU3971]|uniref:hypothetical protein n=1 Tax=Inquilinus sp. OTU3971 TaxID=3043855 RepID=UPI00313A935D
MAVIEIQFREKVFFDIIAAQVLRTDPPAALFSRAPAGSFIDRIETGAVRWARDDEVLFSEGEVAVQVPFSVHLTSYEAAKTAGSLQVPQTFPIPCAVWLRIGGAPPAGLRCSIARLEINGEFIPVITPPQTISLAGLGMPIETITLAAGDGVVAVRLFTPTGGWLVAPAVNRLGGADWGLFLEGQVFADQLAEEMNHAADGVVQGSSDPIEISSRAVGHWDAASTTAYASVDLVAVDRLPADIDVPFTVYAATRLNLNAVLDRIEVLTTISWAAHDVITTVSGGAIEVVEDEVSAAILEKLKPPAGQEEVERGERHIVLRQNRPMPEPVTNLFRATLDHYALTGAGVEATGAVTVYPPPVAHFTLEEAHWTSEVNCNTRRLETNFTPPTVHIFCADRFYSLAFRANPTADPDKIWVPRVSWSGFGAGNQIAHVVFDVPLPGDGGLRPPGTWASGFIVTNMGVRWVDLGVVPVRPAAPADPIAVQAEIISTCMAISDPWGMGILNLDWLVDPPDILLGRPPLREWTITAAALAGIDRVQLVARGPAGERPLANPQVRRGEIFAQVVTDADEVLQLRSGGRTTSAPPDVFQRWIVPWRSAAIGRGGVELTEATDVAVASRTCPNDEPDDDASLRTAGRGRAVMVMHRGEAVLGFAGRFHSLTELRSQAK